MMYSALVQMLYCRRCPLEERYPRCSACDYKASFDSMKAKEEVMFRKYWAMQTPLLTKLWRQADADAPKDSD